MEIAIAHCEGIDPSSTGHSVAAECLRQLQGHVPHTGILFANDEIDHQALLETIGRLLPAVTLAGCCAVGEISSTAGFREDSVVLMLFAGDEVKIGSGYGTAVSRNAEKAALDAVRMARAGISDRERLCLVFGDGLVGKHTRVIEYLNDELAEGCGIFGGMSGLQRYNYNDRHTTQFYNRQVLQDAVVILLFSGPLSWTYALCNSWQPIGPSTTITGVEDNAVTHIGNRSALEFFRNYLGPHSQPATEHPFAVYEDDTPRFYLRVPTGYDEQTGSISFPVPLPLGARTQITESSRRRALEDIRTMMAQLTQINANFCCIFSCDIRKNIFGTRTAEEVQTIRQCLGQSIPTIGFYTLGEVAPLDRGGRSIVHHCTLVVLLVRLGTDHRAEGAGKDTRTSGLEAGKVDDFLLPKDKEAFSLDLLKRQVKKERYYRKTLEDNKELMSHLYRKLNLELAEKNRELQEAREILEQRVAERTHELTEANARLQQEISERIRAFTEKEALEKQLFHAQKMEALGTLAGGIAHDFNNILTPILGYTEMLMLDDVEDEESLEGLQQIFQAGRRAQKLIEQILQFSRGREQELQPLQVGPIVKETLKLLRSSIPQTIVFRQDIRPGLGCVLAEPTQVHQIVMNLCTNAFHAIGQNGGTLEIMLEEVDLGNENGLRLDPGAYLHLVVGDTGCGMDGQVQKRIFEPYFTTKEAGKGTGLGLAVTHGIVSKYRGGIEVKSQLHEGTEVHVYLPVVQAGSAEGEERSVLAELPKGKEHILLIDDEKMIVEMYGSVLQRLGYSVTKESRSRRGLERFLAAPDSFALVILDYAMPGLNGGQVARRILADYPHMPIILTTGNSAMVSERELLQLGIRRCLAKPISLTEFSGTVREVLDDQAGMRRA